MSMEYDWTCIHCYDWTGPEIVDLDEKGNDIINVKQVVTCISCHTTMVWHPRNESKYKLIKAP